MITVRHQKRGESYFLGILEWGKKKKSNRRKRFNPIQWGYAGIQSALWMKSNLLSCLDWGIGSWQLSDNAQKFTSVFHSSDALPVAWKIQKFIMVYYPFPYLYCYFITLVYWLFECCFSSQMTELCIGEYRCKLGVNGKKSLKCCWDCIKIVDYLIKKEKQF